MRYAIIVRGNPMNNYASIGVTGPFETYTDAVEFNRQHFTFHDNNEITEFRYPVVD